MPEWDASIVRDFHSLDIVHYHNVENYEYYGVVTCTLCYKLHTDINGKLNVMIIWMKEL
jgi:hypothetical protein